MTTKSNAWRWISLPRIALALFLLTSAVFWLFGIIFWLGRVYPEPPSILLVFAGAGIVTRCFDPRPSNDIDVWWLLPTLLAAMALAGCMRTDAGYVSLRCARSAATGTVDSAEEAILAARRIWYCTEANLEQTDEQHWLRNSIASKSNGVWHISPVIPEGYVGGGLNMEISQADGHLINMWLTQ
jgi:hypothetical protein